MYINKPAVIANIQFDASQRVPSDTPNIPPTKAVSEEMKFIKRAFLIDRPELRRTAKSPKG